MTAALLLAANPSTIIFRFPTQPLGFDHAAFLRTALGAFTATFFFDGIAPRRLSLAQNIFEFLAKFLPGQFSIRRLRTLTLHPHFDPRGPVAEADRRGSFIDFLTTRARSAHKFFFHVGRNDAQGIKSPLDLRW